MNNRNREHLFGLFVLLCIAGTVASMLGCVSVRECKPTVDNGAVSATCLFS